MSGKRGGSPSTDYKKLTNQLLKGKAQPKLLPSALPLGSIRLWPNVFQHRRPGGHASEGHVRRMSSAVDVNRQKMLSAITVWWDGKSWACVDGHHRYAAYRAAAVGAHPIPVDVFEGSLADAMGRAAVANSKDKLDMSSAEKSDAAWRMVALTDMSKAQAALASDVSESTVAAMRRVRSLLEARVAGLSDDFTGVVSVEFRDLRWSEAKRLAAGAEPADFDRDSANEIKAQKMAVLIVKALGREGSKYPEILARALDIYDTRLMDRLVECWQLEQEDEESMSDQ